MNWVNAFVKKNKNNDMDIAFADFISTLVKTKIANKYRKPFSSYDSDSESSLT